MALLGYSVPETLTDDAGNAMKGITVTVTGPSSYSGTAVSNATTGVLRLGPLPPGDYTVTYGSRSVTVPIVVSLPSGGTTGQVPILSGSTPGWADLPSTGQPLDSDLTAIAALDSSTAGVLSTDGAGWIRKTYAQLKTALALTKGDVGLGNVDNTSDVNKPVSTAVTAAIAAQATTDRGTYAPLDARDTSITSFTVGMLVSSGSSIWRVTTAHAAPFDSTKATQQGGTPLASAVRAGGIGYVAKGVIVPAGSLDIFYAARNASATTRCEIVALGDSTLYGQHADGSAISSWLQTVRTDMLAAGYADGRRGYEWNTLSTDPTATASLISGEPVLVSARTGFNATSLYAPANKFVSTTANDTITLSFIGSVARLWFTRFTQAGQFTYQINGGTVVKVNGGSGANPSTPRPASTSGIWSEDFILLTTADGLVGGGATNTIKFVCVGGNPAVGPNLNGSTPGTSTAAGGPAAGTYYYTMTSVIGGVETTIGQVSGPVTVNGSQTTNQIWLNDGGVTSYNLYRGTSASGPFQLIQTGLTGSGTYGGPWTDNTSATPGATAPATTTALNTTFKTVAVNIDALDPAGIVLHNHGIPGAPLTGIFGTYDTSNNQAAIGYLGLADNNTNPSEQIPPSTKTGHRAPALSILYFGVNDIQYSSALAVAPGSPAATIPTPTVADAGAGNLGAGTYFYKITKTTLAGESAALCTSAGVTVAASHAVNVTFAPQAGAGQYNLYRSTTVGGVYGLVGSVHATNSNGSAVMVYTDNLTTVGTQQLPGNTGNASLLPYSPLADYVAAFESSVGMFIRMARNAGGDCLIVAPPGESAQNSREAGPLIRKALLSVAQAYGVAYVDSEAALGPSATWASKGFGGGVNNPHLTAASYVAIGHLVSSVLLL